MARVKESTERWSLATISRCWAWSLPLGRTFLPEEDQSPGAHPVAVVSHGLWQRRFCSDRDLLGKVLTLNGASFTVVGVMPERFTGIEFWVIHWRFGSHWRWKHKRGRCFPY